MSTYTSEPGTRLAGRYRLEDQVDAGGGWALWKAIDEILARAVTVLMFAENFPRVREAVTAARAASRLNDSRLSQVFDVDDSGERAYIVMEWVAGESLADMLSDGPLDPAWAAALVAEAAQAISVAHAAGLAHLKLVPGSLRWTSGGGAKITGLGMDAAIAGAGTAEDGAEDPAIVDTRQLGLAHVRRGDRLLAGPAGHRPAARPGHRWVGLHPPAGVGGHAQKQNSRSISQANVSKALWLGRPDDQHPAGVRRRPGRGGRTLLDDPGAVRAARAEQPGAPSPGRRRSTARRVRPTPRPGTRPDRPPSAAAPPSAADTGDAADAAGGPGPAARPRP